MKLRAVCLAIVLGTACTDFIGPQPAADHGSVFDDVWRAFDLHYSFFELKRVNWDSLGAHYRPLAVAAVTEGEFATVLGRMLGELHDVHVAITPGAKSAPMRQLAAVDTASTYFATNTIFTRYVAVPRFTSGSHIRYGMAAPTVGYIFIASFGGGEWSSELDEAIAGLPLARAFVVDVRNNVGGNYQLAVRMAGRFADGARVFGYVRRRNGPQHNDFTGFDPEIIAPDGPRQFLGPVVVIGNRRTVSTGENFVLAMRALPSVTIMGDTTAGASGAPIVRELANGWTYQLSEWIEYTPARAVFEGIGLPPDVVVRSMAADWNKGVDAALERAIGFAGARAGP